MLEIPHPLWILSPLLNCAHSEIFFPCVSLEFLLFCLKPCVSCLVSFHCPPLWGAGLHLLSLRQLWTAVTSSLSCCFWLSRAVSLSFSSREEEQCATVPNHLGDPLWDFTWSVNICIVFASPKLATVFQLWLQQCWGEGKDLP